jgi:hypothetical protein
MSPRGTLPVWTEPAIGAEARSLRRWARRTLPSRISWAVITLLGAWLMVVGFGRVLPDFYWVCGYSFGSTKTECPPPGPTDLWDAVF